MSQFRIELFDPHNKVYVYHFKTKNYVKAVESAMDAAFEEMPNNKFALGGYEEVSDANWLIEDLGQYLEIIPQDGIKKHLAGDECSCAVRTLYEDGDRPIILHTMFSKEISND